MYPNFCFSKSNNENLLRMKTQQCLRESKLCNCNQATCTKTAKKPKSARPHVSILRDKCSTKRSNKSAFRTNSPVENAKPCVTFQLKDRPAKCDCGRNCNETSTKCELENERERERERERNRTRERDRERDHEYDWEQRYEREHELHSRINRKRMRGRAQKRNHERDLSHECEPNRKPDVNFVNENGHDSQQEHFMEQNDCKDDEAMQNDDDFNMNKQLQESCADFLNIIHDNVLETVQSTVEKMLVKYYDQTMMRIDNLTIQVESNASLLNKAYIDLLAKIIEQNENSVNQFKFVAQMLIDQQQQHLNTQNYHTPSGAGYETVYEANVLQETDNECLNNANGMNSSANYQQQQQQEQLQQQQQQHQQQQQSEQQNQQQQHAQNEQHTSPQVGQQQQQQPSMAFPYQNVPFQSKTMPISYLDMAYQNYLMWQNSNVCAHTHNCFTCSCHAKKSSSKKSTTGCPRTKADATATSPLTSKSCRRLAKGFSSPNLSNIFHAKVKMRAKATACQMTAPSRLPSLTKMPPPHCHATHPTEMRCNSCTNPIGMRKTISMKTSPSLNASIFTQSTTHI